MIYRPLLMGMAAMPVFPFGHAGSTCSKDRGQAETPGITPTRDLACLLPDEISAMLQRTERTAQSLPSAP